MEIETYVSDSSLARITVGQTVHIDQQFEGIVTSVAPGLDPVTKKARVTIGLTNEETLVHGSFVEVTFLDTTDTVLETDTPLMIPLTAIKVLPLGFVVFTVSPDNILEAHSITEGPIVGSNMLIPEGLTADLKIVIDVRGLKDGEQVEVIQTND